MSEENGISLDLWNDHVRNKTIKLKDAKEIKITGSEVYIQMKDGSYLDERGFMKYIELNRKRNNYRDNIFENFSP